MGLVMSEERLQFGPFVLVIRRSPSGNSKLSWWRRGRCLAQWEGRALPVD